MSQFQSQSLSFVQNNASVTNITNSLGSAPVPVNFDSCVLVATVDVNTPSAAVSASSNQVTSSSGLLFTTSTAHNFTLGLKVQFTTSSALPTGISAATDYFVVPISSTTYKVATSLANALAGTVVAYTDTGTGNQTATPVALAGCSIALQGSGDASNWVTIPNTSVTITADATLTPIELDYMRYGFVRAYVAMTAGQITFSNLQLITKVEA